MSDENRPAPHPAPTPWPVPLRPLTRQLVEAIAFDMWPGNAAVLDFGLNSQQHYEALYYPVRNGEITAGQLERALGSGARLTELANAAPSNPHKGIAFRTAWDDLRLEPEPGPAPHPGPDDSPNCLPKAGRAALVREVFDSAVAAMYFESKSEHVGELQTSAQSEDGLRGVFQRHMEERHWAEWRAEAAGYSDDHLLGLLEGYQGRLDALGMTAIREQIRAETDRNLAGLFGAAPPEARGTASGERRSSPLDELRGYPKGQEAEALEKVRRQERERGLDGPEV